jgi:hypothetical protein
MYSAYFISQQDTGCWILDAGYWLLDAGYWLLDAGYWILVTEYRTKVSGYSCIRDSGMSLEKIRPMALHSVGFNRR